LTMTKEKKEKTAEKAEKESKEKQEIEEITNLLKSVQAEFENYKKRSEKEKEEFVKYANSKLLLKILTIVDSFEQALKNTTAHEEFVKGVELIYAQLVGALEAEGLRPIKTAGEKFDPYRHEVLLQEESDKDEDMIIEELQKGYMMNDKVLRYAKVKISKGMKKDGKDNKENTKR